MLATSSGDVDGAVRHLRMSLVFAEQIDDLGARVAALNNLALAHRASGDLAEALRLTRSALEVCARVGDRHREAALHNNLADLLHDNAEPEPAMEHLKRAVSL
ncbi:MAG: tetratricopeptide repeat protein, partial [Geodermatophilaceae bacterium]|nr:tetratricopeptide repeat protein [Geodermatophilaceae bacterium]